MCNNALLVCEIGNIKLKLTMGSLGCPLCCKHDFVSVVALHEHLLYYVYRPLTCCICNAHVGGIQELAHHLERHLGDGISTAICKSSTIPDPSSDSLNNMTPRVNCENSSAVQEDLNFYGTNDNRLWKKWGENSNFLSPSSREEPIELTLRAYFCNTCGEKVVGKDAYFLHIKQHNSRPSSYVPNELSSVNSSCHPDLSSPVWNDTGPISPQVVSASSTPINIMTDSETVTSEDTREATASPEARLSNVEENQAASQLLKLREWQLGKHGRRFRKHQLSFSSSPRVSNHSPLSEKMLSSISPSTIIDPGSVERPLPDNSSGFEATDKIVECAKPPSLPEPSSSSGFSLETSTTRVYNDNSESLEVNTPAKELVGVDDCTGVNGNNEVLRSCDVITPCTSSVKEPLDIALHGVEEDVPLDDCMIRPLNNDCFSTSPSFQAPPSGVEAYPEPSADVSADQTDSSMFTSYSWISPHHPIQLIELDATTTSIPNAGANNSSSLQPNQFGEGTMQSTYVSSEGPVTSSGIEGSQGYTDLPHNAGAILPNSSSHESNALLYNQSAVLKPVPNENCASVDYTNDLKSNSLQNEPREFNFYSDREVERRESIREDINYPLPSVSGTKTCHGMQNTTVGIDSEQPSNIGYPNSCMDPYDNESDLPDRATSNADSCGEYSDDTRPYFHKKFHHDQERKVVPISGIGQNSDVSRYIHSFQSLLVSKLNGTLSTGLPFKSADLCSQSSEMKQKEKTTNNESQVVRRRLPCEFLCEVCSAKFTTRTAYKSHYKSHEIEGQKNFKCPYCEKEFFRKRTKDLHLRKHTGEQTHHCEQCPQIFTRLYAYQRHQREVHDTRKPFICAECSRAFSSQRQLDGHIDIHRSEKLHKCDKCDHACHTASGLRTHKLEAHSSAKDREYQCHVCGKRFKKPSGLKRHVQRKHAEQTLKCDLCPRMFSCRENLLQHKKTHTSEPLSCRYCEKTFSSSWNLHRHAVTHEDTSHPQKCSKCAMTFTRLDSLKNHLKVHAQKKQYACHCGKKFVKKSQLKEHEDKHSELPKYPCTLCGRAFKFKVSLKNHSCKVNAEVNREKQTIKGTC